MIDTIGRNLSGGDTKIIVDDMWNCHSFPIIVLFYTHCLV